jgi:hypothetical protein
MSNVLVHLVYILSAANLGQAAIEDRSSLREKAEHFQQDLLDKHWLDGLYVSIVPASSVGIGQSHTVDRTGNVIHAGVWTGRYLAGVGYQYAVTADPFARKHGDEILRALRILQEVIPINESSDRRKASHYCQTRAFKEVSERTCASRPIRRRVNGTRRWCLTAPDSHR